MQVGMCKDNILSEEQLAQKRQQQQAKKRVSIHQLHIGATPAQKLQRSQSMLQR